MKRCKENCYQETVALYLLGTLYQWIDCDSYWKLNSLHLSMTVPKLNVCFIHIAYRHCHLSSTSVYMYDYYYIIMLRIIFWGNTEIWNLELLTVAYWEWSSVQKVSLLLFQLDVISYNTSKEFAGWRHRYIIATRARNFKYDHFLAHKARAANGDL